MSNNIQKAVKLLKSGECVAIPTETVYGLAADASNSKAVRKIFKIKNRPINHPVIVHIYSQRQLKNWVEVIPDSARKLMKKYWPGPMTLIFKAKKNVSKIITGGQDSVGIRMPSHPMTRKLLKAFGGAVAAPSANRFGRISPTSAEDVKAELGNKIKLILDGGRCKIGIESAIIDITQNPSRVLRPGILNIKLPQKNKKSPRVSGSLKSHYAPETKVILAKKMPKEKNIGVMSFETKPKNFSGVWIKMPKNPKLYARKLYATLRKLDGMKLNKIYVEPLRFRLKSWDGVFDRLSRLAS